MTQHELCIKWVEEHGYIRPAKMAGKIYYDVMFGSETSKRCRELRDRKIFESNPDPDNPKFEIFYKTGNPPSQLQKPIIVEVVQLDPQVYSTDFLKRQEQKKQLSLI